MEEDLISGFMIGDCAKGGSKEFFQGALRSTYEFLTISQEFNYRMQCILPKIGEPGCTGHLLQHPFRLFLQATRHI